MFQFLHNNINVLDLERSMKFYKEALDLEEVRRKETPNFTLVYLGDHGKTPHLLELTWLKDRKEPYNLGDNEIHFAVPAAVVPGQDDIAPGAQIVCGLVLAPGPSAPAIHCGASGPDWSKSCAGAEA